MVKLRENKELLRDSAFMEKLDKNILVDIIKELEFIPWRFLNYVYSATPYASNPFLLLGHIISNLTE